MKKSWIAALLLAASLAAQGAHASFVFTIERISDTEALITGSGSASGLGNGVSTTVIPLDGVLTGPAGGSITIGAPNDLKFDNEGSVVVVTDVLLGVQDIELQLSPYLYDGYAASGSIRLTVGANKWVAVGSTGSNGRGDTWSMVPEPGSLALLGLGVAGIGAVRRRKLAA